MMKMAVFEHKCTNIFSPNHYTDFGMFSIRRTSPNTTQNKYRGGWGISTEVDHRDLYLTSPDMADLFKMYVFFHRGPKSLPPVPTIAGISPTGVDALGIIWVNDSGASLISGTIDSDRKNYKIHDFWQIFCKNTKKKHRRTFVIRPGS